MNDGTLPGYWDNHIASFVAANGTRAKVLVDVSPAQVAPAIAGEIALPNEGAIVRQRVLTGGRRVIDGLITSSDAANALSIYTGVQMTLFANMGAVATTAAGNATVTRSIGSFIADGWQTGALAMLFGSTSSANDGMPAIVIDVTATVLTFFGVAAVSVAEVQEPGFRIVRVGQPTTKSVPAAAGTVATAGPVPLIGSDAQDPRLDADGIMLGANGMLIVAPKNAVGALPAMLSATAHSGGF